MDVLEIRNIGEYIKIVQSNCKVGTLYRGVVNKDYELIPSLGRITTKDVDLVKRREKILKKENSLMRLFKTHSFQFHKNTNLPEIELLAMAQHHGLKTRLLDWTRSALVALFFALDNLQNCDSAVYFFNNEENIEFIDGESAWKINPYKNSEYKFFIPLNSTSRITAQQGLFLLFSDPILPFESRNLRKIVIPKNLKKELYYDLSMLGINKSILFPDIDGLASYLNWLITD